MVTPCHAMTCMRVRDSYMCARLMNSCCCLCVVLFVVGAGLAYLAWIMYVTIAMQHHASSYSAHALTLRPLSVASTDACTCTCTCALTPCVCDTLGPSCAQHPSASLLVCNGAVSVSADARRIHTARLSCARNFDCRPHLMLLIACVLGVALFLFHFAPLMQQKMTAKRT